MEPDSEKIEQLIPLIDQAELAYPFVSRPLLRRLICQDATRDHLSSSLARLLRASVEAGVVLTDTRLRLKLSGDLEPVKVFRLNRRNPLVARILAHTAPISP